MNELSPTQVILIDTKTSSDTAHVHIYKKRESCKKVFESHSQLVKYWCFAFPNLSNTDVLGWRLTRPTLPRHQYFITFYIKCITFTTMSLLLMASINVMAAINVLLMTIRIWLSMQYSFHCVAMFFLPSSSTYIFFPHLFLLNHPLLQ